MIRALALAGSLYQSAAAIVLIVCVSHLLSAEAYTAFSLVLASGQFAGILAFEWLQIAGVRYLAAATAQTVPRLRASLFLAAALGAAVLAAAVALVLALGATATGLPPVPADLLLLGLGIAVAQGLTDLTLNMIRVGGRLGRSAALMVLRASAIAAATIAAAWLDGSARFVLAGNLAGQAVGLAAALLSNPDLVRGAPWRLDRSDLARLARFGMPAAGASVTHLTVPVAIRYLVVGWYAANPAISAAASLALDLLQRPFAVAVSAIHLVGWPEVVAAHDRGERDEARAAAARLLEFMLCATAILLGGLIAFLPEAARLLVRPELRDGFVRVGTGAALFYFLHTQIQATLALVPQLREATGRLTAVAAIQLVLVAALVAAGVRLGASPRDALLLGALGTAAAAIYAARTTLAFGAFPHAPLMAAALAGSGALAATALLDDPGLPWLGTRIVLSILVVAGIARAGDFLRLRGGTPRARPDPRTELPDDRTRRSRGQPRGAARTSSRRRAERSQA